LCKLSFIKINLKGAELALVDGGIPNRLQGSAFSVEIQANRQTASFSGVLRICSWQTQPGDIFLGTLCIDRVNN